MNQGAWQSLDQGAWQGEELLLSKQLIANIQASGQAAANIKDVTLISIITSTGTVGADLTGTWTLAADITGSGTVSADIVGKTNLAASITGSGTIAANLRLDIQYLVAAITGSGLLVGDIWGHEHCGSLLQLEQEVDVDTVLSLSASSTLDFQQDVIVVFGQRSLSASNILNLTHQADAIYVLPIATASSTLNLTQAVVASRECISYLVLTHSAIGAITFFEGVASSVLDLTHSVSIDGSFYTLTTNIIGTATLGNVLNFEGNLNASNTLNLWQNSFPVSLGAQKYVLFQAPFELLQTSVALPNPEFGDTENLVSNLVLRRSMNGTRRTYVKTSANRRLKYTFRLSRLKALELENFFDAYNGATIKMVNWRGEVWKIKLITNPVDFVQTGRAEPGGDRTDVNLEFEGVKLYG